MPKSWFPNDTSPVIDGVLNACAYVLAYIYSMLAYVRLQTRIATATDGYLDLLASDFFGDELQRRAQEDDDTYRQRIKDALYREKVTKRAVVKALTDLMGTPPDIYEPQNTQWGYGGYTAGYGKAGKWGSNLVPYQGFITVTIGTPGAPKFIAGYSTPPGAYGTTGSRSSYGNAKQVPAVIKDQHIYDAINAVKPFGVVAWVNIQHA